MYRRLMLPVGLGLTLVLAVTLGWLTSYAAPQSTPGAAPRLALPAVDVGGEWSTTLTVQNMGGTAYAVLDLYPVGAECTLSIFTPAFRYCLGDIGPLQARTTTLMGIPPGQYSGTITAYSACPENGGVPIYTLLSAVVARQRVQGEQTAASAYTALAPTYDGWDAASERYIYYSPHVRTSPGAGGTVISVQNTGDQCASVRALFYPESFADNAGCAPQAGSLTADIPPGGSFRFDPAAAGLPVFFGAARLEADQPLAVTTDVTAGGDRQMFTYTGQPYRPHDGLAVLPLVLSMPLNPAPWLSTLKAQNPSAVDATLVSETLRNRDGSGASSVISQRLCPGSSRLLQARDFSQDPNFIGSADIVNGPGVVILQNTSLDQLEGYSALAASESGSVLSLPRLRREENNGVVTLRSQVAVRNLSVGAGATVSLTLYNEAGEAIDTETEEVEPEGTVVFDLAGLAYLGDGWRGSGIVRAVGAPNARLAAVALERSSVAGSDLSRTYVGARIVQLPPTPTPTTSPTATETPIPPTLTPTITPTGEPGTATPTPTNTPTPQPTVTQLTPAPGMAGYAVSSAPNTNFLGAGEVYSGHDRRGLKPLTWIGAVQFDVSSVPNTAALVGAEVQITGKTSAYLDGASGVRWEMQLLDESVDAGWRTISYLTLSQAAVDDRLTPTVARTEVGEGVVNTFTFTPAGLAVLQERLTTTDRVSLRIVATQPGVGYRAIFTWDSGMATGNWVRPPVLRLTYQ